ncbi:MAG: TM0106 family RecB-like putative nuclease [Acidimicrobiales bacterium]|nr:TM0106 family RecB-like putative nuclease [Acidimicrobiales bacterium]
MLNARLDVSGVPPQRGQVAKRCPVRAPWDALAAATEVAEVEARGTATDTDTAAPPGHPQAAPTPATITRRLELSDRFVADVVATLVEAHPDAVVVPAAPADERVDATVEAMAAGAPVIVGGRLPDDEEGRRRGDPAVLVAAGGGGYHPIEVALHRTLERPRSGAPITPVVSSLAAPWLQAAGPLDDVVARPGEGADAEPLVAAKRKGDLLQLAHLRRMLEACGQAASSNVGGVIGTDGIVVWYDLDAPLWTTPSTSEGTKVRSTMAVYDFEYGFRLDVVATAQAHAADPSVPLLVVPVRIGECSSCPWWGSCRAELEARHDVSLLPRFGWNRWKRHRERGVATIADLAGLDHRTAALVDQQVDVAGLLGAADDADAGLDDDAPLGPLVEAICGDGAEAAAAHLDAAGITTVGELRQLDRRAAAYTGVDVGPLAPSIDTARARLTEAPAMLARGRTAVAVPRGDVEIDLDLESTEAGVYLWGALVTDRAGTGLVTEGYLPFVTWDHLDHPAEVAVFEQLMDWLDGVQSALAAAGRSWCVYCFNDRAEAGELRRLAASPLASPGRADQVEALVRHPGWVDLLRVAQASIVTGGSMGLKALAPMAGFAWEDDDAGGEQSMGWHDLAVDAADPAVRDANRARLLTYNRNDVEATLALRRWMCAEAAGLPRLDDSDAAWGW